MMAPDGSAVATAARGLAALSIDASVSDSHGNAEADVAAAPAPRTKAISAAAAENEEDDNDDDDDKKPPAKDEAAIRLQLPPDVVAIVLLHVDIGEIPTVAAVSKDWNTALKRGEDEHYLYLLQRHKNILSRFSDKVLVVDGIGSVDGGRKDGNVDAAAGDNTASISNSSANDSVGEGGDELKDRLKPSPKWKMLFRRALFIMKLAHNPSIRLNMLDGPDNRTTLAEPRSDCSYNFTVNVRVLSNDPMENVDFGMAPSSVPGSNIDEDGSLLVEIPRNDLCPIPAPKLAKGFIWISLRHNQSRSSPVVFRGSYASLDGLKFKKRYKWKDMELANGDLVAMGRKVSLFTRNRVETDERTGKINIRLQFDMECLAVGNDAGKELFQDLSQLEFLRVLESLLFVNGPMVYEKPKAEDPSIALGRPVATSDSRLPRPFASRMDEVAARHARTVEAIERHTEQLERLQLETRRLETSSTFSAASSRRALSAQSRRQLLLSRRARLRTPAAEPDSSMSSSSTSTTGATSAAESSQQTSGLSGGAAASQTSESLPESPACKLM